MLLRRVADKKDKTVSSKVQAGTNDSIWRNDLLIVKVFGYFRYNYINYIVNVYIIE
jgi:hypothetical protein